MLVSAGSTVNRHSSVYFTAGRTLEVTEAKLQEQMCPGFSLYKASPTQVPSIRSKVTTAIKRQYPLTMVCPLEASVVSHVKAVGGVGSYIAADKYGSTVREDSVGDHRHSQWAHL